MELFSLGIFAYNQYTTFIKHNNNVSYKEAMKKMTRNLLLSVPIEQDTENFDGTWFAYGRMR